MLGTTAFFLALIFLFSVTGRWLSHISGPALQFLRESWALSGDPVVQESRLAVVQIYADKPGDAPRSQTRGSGFNLQSHGLIVTNRHLVEGAKLVRISFPGEGTFVAEQWELSPYADLAVIRLQEKELPYLQLSRKPVLPGDELLIIGNPLQFVRVATSGSLVGFSENPAGNEPFMVIEAAIYPGSSGSPVFDSSGGVVGVVFATLRSADPSETLGLAVDARELRYFDQW